MIFMRIDGETAANKQAFPLAFLIFLSLYNFI